MNRSRALLFSALFVTVLALALSHAGRVQASSSDLAALLERAQVRLRQEKRDLVLAERQRDAALAEHRRRGLALLYLKVWRAQRDVQRSRALVATLQRRLAAEQRLIAEKGRWWPLILEVARANEVSADGMYRLMMLESGGRETAHGGGGLFHGLYQYTVTAWHGGWNPWRATSIFSGEAQVRATGRALRLDKGSYLWPKAYPRAF